MQTFLASYVQPAKRPDVRNGSENRKSGRGRQERELQNSQRARKVRSCSFTAETRTNAEKARRIPSHKRLQGMGRRTRLPSGSEGAENKAGSEKSCAPGPGVEIAGESACATWLRQCKHSLPVTFSRPSAPMSGTDLKTGSRGAADKRGSCRTRKEHVKCEAVHSPRRRGQRRESAENTKPKTATGNGAAGSSSVRLRGRGEQSRFGKILRPWSWRRNRRRKRLRHLAASMQTFLASYVQPATGSRGAADKNVCATSASVGVSQRLLRSPEGGLKPSAD